MCMRMCIISRCAASTSCAHVCFHTDPTIFLPHTPLHCSSFFCSLFLWPVPTIARWRPASCSKSPNLRSSSTKPHPPNHLLQQSLGRLACPLCDPWARLPASCSSPACPPSQPFPFKHTAHLLQQSFGRRARPLCRPQPRLPGHHVHLAGCIRQVHPASDRGRSRRDGRHGGAGSGFGAQQRHRDHWNTLWGRCHPFGLADAPLAHRGDPGGAARCAGGEVGE